MENMVPKRKTTVVGHRVFVQYLRTGRKPDRLINSLKRRILFFDHDFTRSIRDFKKNLHAFTLPDMTC